MTIGPGVGLGLPPFSGGGEDGVGTGVGVDSEVLALGVGVRKAGVGVAEGMIGVGVDVGAGDGVGVTAAACSFVSDTLQTCPVGFGRGSPPRVRQGTTMCPVGSTYLSGFPLTYMYLFQLCGFSVLGTIVSGLMNRLR